MPDCAFCDILAGRLPASLVAQSPRSLAFCDLRQPHEANGGAHVLVIPRRHVETLDALTDDAEAGDLLRLAARVAAALKAEYGDSYSLWQSNGDAAFQEVPHVHLHLLTRRPDDGLLQIYPGIAPGKPPPPAPREQLHALAQRLRVRLGE